MKNLARIFLAGLAFLFASSAHAQIDIAITGATPLSNVRVYKSDASDVTVGLKNVGASISKQIKVKVTIRTYTGILVYADSITIDPLAKNQSTIATLADFFPPETGYYAVAATTTTPNDINEFNNLFSNQRLPVQFDVAVMGITAPTPNQSFLQKLTFPIRGRFRSQSLIQELDVKARVVIRRCFDDAIVFVADTSIPDLPKDTVTVNFTFPSQQGNYDVRKLAPGCYKLEMMTLMLSDWDRKNDVASTTFNINSNTVPNDVSIDSIYSTKGTTIKPGEEMPLTLWFGNVGLNAQSSVPTSLVITNENDEEVYRESMTLSNWIVGETKTEIFPSFKSEIGGTYTLHAFTSLPNDDFRFNDTLTRTVSVEKAFQITIDSIYFPQAGQALEIGRAFIPRARFTWSGSVVPPSGLTGVFQIKAKSGGGELYFYSTLTGFSESVHSIDVDFTEPYGGSFNVLGPGDHLAFALVANNKDLLSFSDTIIVRIAFQHDVRLDSSRSPAYYRSYPLAPIAMDQLATNVGLVNEPEVSLDVVITDRKGAIAYHEIGTSAISVLEQKSIPLPNFTPQHKGMFEAQFQVDVANETHKTDNTIFKHRFHVGSMYDPALDSAINPTLNEIKLHGKRFTPTVYLDWLGVDTVSTEVALDLRILECTSHAEVYHQTGKGKVGKSILTHDVKFSETSLDGTRLQDLPVGCYHAIFIATHALDTDHSDDTLVVPFSIGEQGSVASDGNSHISLVLKDRMLIVSGLLPVSTVTLFDLRGAQLMQVNANGESASVALGSAPSGTYIVEVRSKDSVDRRLVNYTR